MNPFYLFRVRAQNCAGWGPWSAPTDAPPVELAVDLDLEGLDTKRVRESVADKLRAEGADLSWLEKLFDDISEVVERNVS